MNDKQSETEKLLMCHVGRNGDSLYLAREEVYEYQQRGWAVEDQWQVVDLLYTRITLLSPEFKHKKLKERYEVWAKYFDEWYLENAFHLLESAQCNARIRQSFKTETKIIDNQTGKTL